MAIRRNYLIFQIILRIYTIFFVLLKFANSKELQIFATEPSHQTAVLGSTAVLPCRVVNKIGMVQWTRDGFGLGTVRKLQGFERYSMIGSDEEGDFSLRISPVTLEDDADYQCQVSSHAGPPLRSRLAKLTVLVPPKSPIISLGPDVSVTAGSNITLTCQSFGGRPAPEIQWLNDSAGIQIRDGLHYSEIILDDQKRVKAESSLTFIPTRHHHNHTLTCFTHNPALNEPLSATITMKVEYPPEINLKLHPAELAEGKEAKISCITDANPNEVFYRWYRNGIEAVGETGSTLNLGVLTRADHGSPIACEATNSIGTIRRNQRISLKYSPRFLKPPESISAEIGSNISMKCRVDSNPPPEITWHFQKTKMIVGRGAEMRTIASSVTAGQYLCVSKSGEYRPLEGTVNLRLKGPPHIITSKLVTTREGLPTTLKCDVTAVPHPLTVTWTRNGSPINPEVRGRVMVSAEQLADGVISKLVINITESQDFSTYNCSVVNEYGVATAQITLRKEAIVPLVPIVGGIAGIVLVVISIILFIICHHHFKPIPCEKSVEASKMAMQVNTSKSDILQSDVTNILTSVLPTHDIVRISDNDSDVKELDNRTGSSMSAGDRDSDHWEGSDKGIRNHNPISHYRYNGMSVSAQQEKKYISYANYSREFSPVHIGETYSQFKFGNPYARSSPAGDQPITLPSSVAPPPYTLTPNLNCVVNGLPNRNSCIIQGRPTSMNSSLKHDLVADLQQPDLTRGVNHNKHENSLNDHILSDPSAIHTKFILPPQPSIKPGTLV